MPCGRRGEMSHMDPNPPRWRRHAARWAGPVAIAAAGAAMLAWSWGTWPDVQIDYGRELRVPWRLSEGAVLYRDVAHFNGPLSAYLDAGLFAIFGTGLWTLVAANLLVLAATVALSYRLLVEAGGRWTATLACLTFVGLFACNQYTPAGNSNWVTPYSQEMTHGMALALAALACLRMYLRSDGEGRRKGLGDSPAPPLSEDSPAGLRQSPRRRLPKVTEEFLEGGAGDNLLAKKIPPARGQLSWLPSGARWLAAAGVCLGLAFLTKMEVSLAATLAVTAGVALALWADRASRRRALRHGGLFLGAALLAPAAAFLLLWTAMPAGQALRGVLGGWYYAFLPGLSGLPYYRAGMGLLEPAQNARRMLSWALGYGAIVVPAVALALLLRRRTRLRAVVAVAVFALVVGVLSLHWTAIPWQEALRPLPLFMLILAVFITRALMRSRSRRAVLPCALALFALVLLLKLGLHARIYHYGFALALPGTMLLAVAAFGWVPAWIRRRGGAAGVVQAAVLGAWLAAAGVHLRVCQSFWARKTVEVGAGADWFLADSRGRAVNAAVAWLTENTAPDETLAAFPEGEMLNYLARRRTSVRYGKFLPPELLMFGAGDVLAALRARPPDVVALVHRDDSEYGVRFFGQDYARRIGSWIRRAYRPVLRIGARPFRGPRFGILLLRRRSSSPATGP